MRPFLAVAAVALVAVPAAAALAPGSRAPTFHTRGALAGKVVDVNLASLLRKGPVVLYFFPAAGTKGCNAEAKAFADAVPQFAAAGATVLGMSGDSVEVLREFSTQECAGKFTVASAGPRVVKGYDVAFGRQIKTPSGAMINATRRVSYVIDRGGHIVYAHDDPRPDAHVTSTLDAVRALRRG
ncbi:peroxiredoxin [Sphingomonas sp.]|uniref:peroxiredoxin n=1 Tax=Sphingomonas sp. TaxID=28214 RepID=UPI002DD62BB6|nr:redoxin domain-containing protein [Sphingomonas sp.]